MRNLDMSPGAIADRIAEVAALNRLCDSLGRAGAAHAGRDSQVAYADELATLLGLSALDEACAGAESAVRVVLMPASEPELCIAVRESSGRARWLVRALACSLRASGAGSAVTEVTFETEKDVLQPLLSAPSGAHLGPSEGLEVDVTVWMGGTSRSARGTVEAASRLADVRGLIEVAAKLVRAPGPQRMLESLRNGGG